MLIWLSALVNAFGLAGAPVPPRGLVLGRGSALLRENTIEERRVRKMRPDLDDPTSASEVHLYRDHSVAPLLSLKSLLRAVLSLLRSIAHNGFTLERALQLDRQWSSVIGGGPACGFSS